MPKQHTKRGTFGIAQTLLDDCPTKHIIMLQKLNTDKETIHELKELRKSMNEQTLQLEELLKNRIKSSAMIDELYANRSDDPTD